ASMANSVSNPKDFKHQATPKAPAPQHCFFVARPKDLNDRHPKDPYMPLILNTRKL
ncbi:20317_t:CDS:1, partial [Dentiscutata erythropus]